MKLLGNRIYLEIPKKEESKIVKEIKEVFEQQNLVNNETFLKKVIENKTLQRGMNNPRLMSIIKEMETNPEIVKKHSNDKEFTDFLKEYMSLIGNQLSQNQEPKKQEIMKEEKTVLSLFSCKNNTSRF